MLRVAVGFVVLIGIACLSGCGGGGSTPPPQPVTVSVTPASASVPAQGSQFFTAIVTNTSNTAVTWKVNGVTGGNSTVGTMTPTGFYTAPAVIPNPSTVTVTAVSQADASKSGAASVAITLGISPLSATVLISGTQQFSVTGAGGPVNWTVTCVAPCEPSTLGTVSGSGLYTAPDAIPDNVLTDPGLSDPNLGIIASPIAVNVALQSDASSGVSASVYVNAGGPEVNQASQSTPIELGTSGGNAGDMTGNFCCSGTLGSLVSRAGVNLILSNNHVLARRDQAKVGEHISEPGLVDTNCSPETTVANFTQAVKLQNANGSAAADAAIAQIVANEVDLTGTVLQLGPVSSGLAGAAPPANTTVAPAIGMAVAKSGRTTGLSCSTIVATNLSVQVGYETGCNGGTKFNVNYTNQIDIGSTTFSAPGDSGSLIVDADTAQPVGLLFAGSSSDTVANPISAPLANLKDSKGNAPTMVGGAQHAVEACTGVGPAPPKEMARLAEDEVQRAITAKEAHVQELMSIPAVIGVGVGASETPGEAAIIVFVEKGKKAGAIPAEVDGVKTRIRETRPFRAFIPTLGCPDKNGPLFPETLLGRSLHQFGIPDLAVVGEGETRLQSRQHAPCVKE